MGSRRATPPWRALAPSSEHWRNCPRAGASSLSRYRPEEQGWGLDLRYRGDSRTEQLLLCFQARLLLRRLDDPRDGTESTRESAEIGEADVRWPRHVLSEQHHPSSNMEEEHSPDISISITTETGQTTLDLEGAVLDFVGSEACGRNPHLCSPSAFGGQRGMKCEPDLEADHRVQGEEGGGERRAAGGDIADGQRGGVAPPDVVQRSHALVYPDITNFLSVESRTRSQHGGESRCSESNFRWVCMDM